MSRSITYCPHHKDIRLQRDGEDSDGNADPFSWGMPSQGWCSECGDFYHYSTGRALKGNYWKNQVRNFPKVALQLLWRGVKRSWTFM